MKYLFVFFIPFLLFANEKKLTEAANKKCGNISNQKEKSACITGVFLDFCQNPMNQKFCKKEAIRSDYSKRMEGAKSILKKAYVQVKKNKGVLNLDKIFKGKSEDSYYYIFGVPKKCKKKYEKGTASNSSKLHGQFERVHLAKKAMIARLNKYPCSKGKKFRIYAVGQLDDDLKFDVWYVDEKKRLKHPLSDLKR